MFQSNDKPKQKYITRFPANLKPMDIILFRGEGTVSQIIMFGHKPGTAFSHVGVIGPDGNLFHGTTLMGQVPDRRKKEPFSGVQLNDLVEAISYYKGEVFVRRLLDPLTDDELDLFKTQFEHFHGLPYEENYDDLINAEIDIPVIDSTTEDFSSVFCSELVAELVEQVKKYYSTLPADEYTPTDCSRYWAGTYSPKIERIKWKV